jgi:RNA polymerase sigma factor (sigma-70 family)
VTGEYQDDPFRNQVRAAFVSRVSRVRASLIRIGATPEQAEDALQEAVETILKKRPQMKNPRAYLMRSARNTYLSLLRTLVYLDEFVEETTVNPLWSGPEHEAVRSELRGRLMVALRRLPQAHREALVMRNDEGLPCAEIARIPGRTEATVRQHHNRATKALSQFLRE